MNICCHIKGIFHYATSFNGDVSSWDVSSVGSMNVSTVAAYSIFHTI